MAKRKHTEATFTIEGERDGKLKESENFAHIFKQYADSIDALREFFSRLSPFVTKLKRGIKRERGAYLKRIVDDFFARASEKEVKELEGFLASIKSENKKSKTTRAFHISDINEPAVQELILKFVRSSLHSTPGEVHRELVNRSILMSLVSYFEVLVADLAHLFYRVAPNAIDTDDKVISVNELKQFNTIDEALHSIVSDRVDKLLRGSVINWQDFFQSRMNIDMELLTPDWAQWNEYFQRRHIMVHAGGHATETYLSHVDWQAMVPHMTKPRVGDKLEVDDAYIEHAVDSFEITGLLLCQEVWKKLLPGDEEVRSSSLIGLSEAIYRRLLSRHWQVAEKLAAWGEKDNEVSENSELTYKFNRWLCVKRQERWSEVQHEVEALDCTALNHKFVLAHASLLENADGFFEVLPKALATENITIGDLKEWPILDEMREDPRFAKVIKETNQ